jgi:hypothetical protein
MKEISLMQRIRGIPEQHQAYIMGRLEDMVWYFLKRLVTHTHNNLARFGKA